MCGIFGSTNISYHSKWKKVSLDALYHRGPDDQNCWYDNSSRLLLGHTRLSIVDLSDHGKQPMHSRSQRYVITYNGEIYNYLEIKSQLEQQNELFRGSSDTEVVLAAIEKWGLEKSLKLFVGMFAFALWDRYEKKLHLVRDRAGIKPLYYAKFKNSFAFASELSPLLSHEECLKKIDRNSLCMYMRKKYVPEPYSLFENIFKVEPATIVTLHLPKFPQIKLNTYWSLAEVIELADNKMIHDAEEAKELLMQQLKLSIKQHCISDVSIGAFLSGGIDSATIVALMQNTLNTSVHTFTVGFSYQGYDESQTAKEIANHLQTNHTSMYLTEKEIFAQIENLPCAYDEPFADSSQIPTLLVAEMAKKHVKVVLSGDGGDEIFGGYNRYIFAPNIWKMGCFIPFRKLFAKMLLSISNSTWENTGQWKLAEKVDKVAHLLMVNKDEIYDNLIACWRESNVVLGSQTKIMKHDIIKDLVTSMMYCDFKSYLPGDILTKVDRATMFHSIEARVPYLDHRLIELAWRIPLSMKIKNGVGKQILRNVLYEYVPKKLFKGPKMGFSLPLHQWLRGPLRDWVENLLDPFVLKEQGFFDVALVREKWKTHLSGQKNYQDDLWTVLMFQSWLKNQA